MKAFQPYHLQLLFVHSIGQMHWYNPIRSFPVFLIFSPRVKKKWRAVRKKPRGLEQTGCSNGDCDCLKQETVWLRSFISVIKSDPSLEWGKPLAVFGTGCMEKFSKSGRGGKKESGTYKNVAIYRQSVGIYLVHCRNVSFWRWQRENMYEVAVWRV